MKKIVIIDDEAAGRKLIKEYLAHHPNLVLVGEANNGVDAIKIIQELQPDLVFLDIQMPGMNGFEVLTHLDEIPPIIFSTAYDQYALQAFEIHAVDYLLKPYTKERFNKAIKRIEAQKTPVAPLQPLAESLLQEQQKYPERILVQAGKKLISITVPSIIRIEADGDYSKLVTEKGNYLSNYGISKLEQKLNPKLFLRVHRSAMVNLQFVESVYKQISSYDIVLKNGNKVRVSRGYMNKIKDLIF